MRGLPGSSTLELSVQAHNGELPEPLVAALGALAGVERVEPIHEEASSDGQPSKHRVRLYVSGEASQLIAPTATLLHERGVALSGVDLGTPTLEDVFIHLTGRTLR
jgi:ABC-2 type transport system ATP-binding protein